jgi:hypothetical protein
MTLSDSKRLAPILLAAAFASSAGADVLALGGGGRLTGDVRGISGKGVVELASPLSPEALMLKPGVVKKVDFNVPPLAAVPPAMVELDNGDRIPCALESLDADTLSVLTPDAGRLAIPRSALQSLQLGITRTTEIYAGPADAREWSGTPPDGRKSWGFENGSLTADGPTIGSRNFTLPRDFILKFTLRWKRNPNFQIYFADPLTPDAAAVDRYFLQFNIAGMEVKRESATGARSQTVMLIQRSPEQFRNGEVAIEIRVDRGTSRLHVLLDGEPEAAGIDPGDTPPAAGGVTLVSSGPPGSLQEIREIRLLPLDDAASRHRAERRGDKTVDSLISRDEERWGGRLDGLRSGADGLSFVFKSDFQDEPLVVPAADVSTIFFARPEVADAAAAASPVVLRLRGDGSLRVASCEFSETGVTAVHPLLGELKIAREGVSAFEYAAAKPDNKPAE